MTIKEIAEQLRSQDNRITDQPMFIVQELKRDYGYDTGWGGDVVWLSDGDEVDEEKAEELQKEYDDTGVEPDGYTLTGYVDRWEFVTACFTEQGCKDFIKIDCHNHKELRIYAHGSYRNQEWRTVRDMLMKLND